MSCDVCSICCFCCLKRSNKISSEEDAQILISRHPVEKQQQSHHLLTKEEGIIKEAGMMTTNGHITSYDTQSSYPFSSAQNVSSNVKSSATHFRDKTNPSQNRHPHQRQSEVGSNNTAMFPPGTVTVNQNSGRMFNSWARQEEETSTSYF